MSGTQLPDHGQTSVLRCQGLRKTFHSNLPGQRPALDGLDLALEAGDFVVIIGSNGAGKSTLLNAVAGAITPDEGRILLGQDNVTDWTQQRRATRISRVFQDPMTGTAAAMTVEENLALAACRRTGHRLRPLLGAQRRARHREELARLQLGLEDRLDTPVALLSGGQRQALALLMAVASEPQLLLLDEHTAALDPKTAAIVMQATLETVAQRALTTLMITHNMHQAIETGNRLVMMDEGRVRFEVRDQEKARLTPEELVERFRIDNDRMLLG